MDAALPPSTTSTAAPVAGNPAAPAQPVIVLLIDDQAIVGHAVKQMLLSETDIQFHFCKEPLKALETARAINPTVILQDLVMPDIDGLTLLKFFRADPHTKQIPMIVLSSKEEATVKAQAFGLGANDYLVKLPDRIELIARIRHHSEGYIAQLQRNEAYRKLAESERMLAEEMAQAAKYVRTLLPPPLKKDPIQVDWRFVPSAQLGGDAFGYHWLDKDRFILFLLDVSGHGVGAALMAVSVFNTLTGKTLPTTDFSNPASVMQGLNAVFSMERQGGHYFTIWYAVFEVGTRKLTWSGGGHPPAMVLAGASAQEAQVQRLECLGPPIGMVPGVDFENTSIVLPPYSRLLLYSDGAVEITLPDGKCVEYTEFNEFLGQRTVWDDPLEQIINRARALRGGPVLGDDCSVVVLDL